MEAKLIKTKVGYHLWLNPETKEQQHIASDCEIVSDNGADLRKYKLSLKNCQAIERGYDLNELEELAQKDIHNLKPINPHPTSFFAGYRRGFQKAIEINDGKLFTIPQVIKLCTDYYKIGAIEVGMPKDRRAILPREIIEDIKRLQKTEWEVEVEMWFHGTRHKKGEWTPKLDAENCLILKRKI